jgi:hypothetical protein
MTETRVRMRTLAPPAVAIVWLTAVFFSQPEGASPQVANPPVQLPAEHPQTMFVTSHECGACHNGLTSPNGEDVSIGVAWRASMMANSSRDPYWQAGVRREMMDHPQAAEAIEDECAICHMPMSSTKARTANRHGEIFAHLPFRRNMAEDDRFAADGVSCSVCHQIGPERLGTRESFNGGFVLAQPTPEGERQMFGPYEVDLGRRTIMRSATGVVPAQAKHLRESEVCATCHTLYTQALGPNGEVLAELPEQVPYVEWQHSAFRQEQSCQSCHMPEIGQPSRIASVVGEDRIGARRHTFLGGNFFMLRMLNRYRNELGVEALPQEVEAAAGATIAQLQQHTASVAIARAESEAGRLAFDITVRNLTGHKLPTAYPSRRAWLHVTVHDRDGQVVFESGAIDASGLIRGNDNDADASRFEPHYTEIRSADQVLVYESIMRDVSGNVTTGLLRGTAYIKDNRLLPRGFDKATATPDIAVLGAAREDPDFTAESDRVRYVVDAAGRAGPFQVAADLRYQPISYRWAQNLRAYDTMETGRFVKWYDEMASGSSQVLASAVATLPGAASEDAARLTNRVPPPR